MFAIVINTTYFDRILSAQDPAEVMIQIFYSGGWVIFLYVLLWGFWKVWHESRRIKWLMRQEWVLLAIDVPKETEQTPKAVESIFATLHGALAGMDRIEKYWMGKLQVRFSFEIVSNGGYVQFYVRTFSRLRDLVEAAIYAQYPDAEISEVDDYVTSVPKTFPAEGWDLFGTEFVLSKKSPYPIRTYPNFEHGLSGDLYFKDPLAVLLESLSKLRPGEQVWIQIIIAPNDGRAWKAAGDKIVQKLIGARVKLKKTMLSELGDFGSGMINQVLGPPSPLSPKREEPPTLMQHLSSGEKLVIEGIQMKIAKVAFDTKIRIIYVGKTEALAKPRTISSLKGSFGLYTILDQNGFRLYVNVTTRAEYPWQTKKIFEHLSIYMIRTLTTRQNSILRAYRSRSMGIGAPPFILNIEELATIFHFPVMTVKTPLLKKTEAKRAEPPFSLPVSAPGVPRTLEPPPPASRTKHAPPPSSIPAKPPYQLTRIEAAEAVPDVPPNLPFV